MIWFPVPQSTPPLVKEFLTYEKEFLQAGLTAKNVLFAFWLLVFIVIVRATWLHSWKLVGLILIIHSPFKNYLVLYGQWTGGLDYCRPSPSWFDDLPLSSCFWQKKKS